MNESPSLADWLAQEPFTLALSAGFFSFFAHTGLLLALERHGLRPRRVVGVSAGALAGGLWASGLPARQIADRLLALRRADFWDPGVPLGGLIKGRKFDDLLREVAPVEQIEEGPTAFAAVAYDVLRWRTVVLDRGPITGAIRASCAVPGMFRPVWHQRRLLVDGGVTDRCGEAALAPGERLVMYYMPSSRTPSAARGKEIEATRARWAGPRCAFLDGAGLPAVGPFKLERGAAALQQGLEVGLRRLEAPVADLLAAPAGPR